MTSLRSKLFRWLIKSTRGFAGTPETIEKRREFSEQSAKMMPMPHGIAVEPITVSGCYAEWLIPDATLLDGAILYLHGGAYAMGSVNTHRPLASRIAKASKTKVLILEYRLAPEHPFPAALQDALGAYRWLLSQNYKPENIFVMGDSAGGGLSLASLLCLRDEGEILPSAAVLLSPITDLTASGESIETRKDVDPMNSPQDYDTFQYYADKYDLSHPFLSPLFADLRGLPSLYIQVGDYEIALSDSTRLAEKAELAGVDVRIEVWDEMWHDWQGYAPYVPEANQAIEKIGEFVQSILG